MILALFTVLTAAFVACGQEPEPIPSEALTLSVGEEYRIDIDDTVYSDYTYETSDEKIALVSSAGVINALQEGSVTIFIKINGNVKFEYKINIQPDDYVPPVVEDQQEGAYRIALDSYACTLFVGGTQNIGVSVYENGFLCEKEIECQIENEEIVDYSYENGIVTLTALSSGKTKLIVKKGSFEASCAITVHTVDVYPLETPEILSITEDAIEWTAVENANGYQVSLDGGRSWKNTDTNAYELAASVNPLKIKVVALANSLNDADSEAGVISLDQLLIFEGKGVKLATDTTVSGQQNELYRQAELSLAVKTKEGLFPVDESFLSWSVENEAVAIVSGKIVSAVTEGKTQVTATLSGGGSVKSELLVGTPIATKADMDALGFASKSENVGLWSYGKAYVLTGDIDYATDVTAENASAYRMTDTNTDADLWDRYLIPIAAYTGGGSPRALSLGNGKLQWGIFGEINQEGKFFEAILDGNGYEIKNAVIPYGTLFSYEGGTNSSLNAVVNNNFIGALVYGAVLRNIAFTGLEFEDPIQIATAGANNPYYTDANPNNAGKNLQANGYITGSSMFNTTYGSYEANNTSSQCGLIGALQNATVENVYVDAILKNGTYGTSCVNGLIVAQIDVDYYANGKIYRDTVAEVKNCISRTAYWTSSNVDYFSETNNYNSGMGTIVGGSKTGLDSTVKNCFTITYTATGVKAIDLAAGVFSKKANTIYAQKNKNCAIYESEEDLKAAQAEVLDQIWILNCLG